VQTTGDEPAVDASKLVGKIRDALPYIPVRVASARAALHDLPIKDFSRYTFVDMGSGKGRMLFVAAERPFRKVQGVEFAIDLNERARENIRENNYRRQKCIDIESIHGNAADFEFPNGNLVVCLFNPFGPEVLGPMLTNLGQSIEKRPRHVILLYIYPKYSHVLAGMRRWRVYMQKRRHHIYVYETVEAREIVPWLSCACEALGAERVQKYF
jgi:SAM-dependent methyltransferase